MTCDWCGRSIVGYSEHFATHAGQPCKVAALYESRIQRLDAGRSHAQIRRSALRNLERTRHRDRLEDHGTATFARPDRERRGRT